LFSEDQGVGTGNKGRGYFSIKILQRDAEYSVSYFLVRIKKKRRKKMGGLGGARVTRGGRPGVGSNHAVAGF